MSIRSIYEKDYHHHFTNIFVNNFAISDIDSQRLLELGQEYIIWDIFETSYV